MNHYETLFVVKPTLTEEEIKGQIERAKEIVSSHGGELKAHDEMGMRRLAYPIEKQERGYYSVLYYTADGDTVHELERQLRYNEEILRFMTVKYSNKKEIEQFGKMVEAANKKASQPSAQTPEPEAPASEAQTAESESSEA